MPEITLDGREHADPCGCVHHEDQLVLRCAEHYRQDVRDAVELAFDGLDGDDVSDRLDVAAEALEGRGCGLGNWLRQAANDLRRLRPEDRAAASAALRPTPAVDESTDLREQAAGLRLTIAAQVRQLGALETMRLVAEARIADYERQAVQRVDPFGAVRNPAPPPHFMHTHEVVEEALRGADHGDEPDLPGIVFTATQAARTAMGVCARCDGTGTYPADETDPGYPGPEDCSGCEGGGWVADAATPTPPAPAPASPGATRDLMAGFSGEDSDPEMSRDVAAAMGAGLDDDEVVHEAAARLAELLDGETEPRAGWMSLPKGDVRTVLAALAKQAEDGREMDRDYLHLRAQRAAVLVIASELDRDAPGRPSAPDLAARLRAAVGE